jgi:hypothetical protein
MIRSSFWNRNGIDLALTGVPAGSYVVYLYFWEDSESQTFDILINERKVRERYASGSAGHWDRLGPWPVSPGPDGRIRIQTTMGDANLSGIEVWRAGR